MSDVRSPESLAQHIKQVENRLLICGEYGIFERGRMEDVDTLSQLEKNALNEIRDAWNSFDGEDLAQARRHVMEADLLVSRGLGAASGWRRWLMLHQIPLLVYLLGMFAILLLLAVDGASEVLPFVDMESELLLGVPWLALIAGGLGAVLRGVYWLWKNVTRWRFRGNYLIAFLAAPWIGMLLGIIIYLMLVSGLLLVGGEGASGPDGELFLPSALALCFLAGFRWEKALDWIDKVFKLGESEDDESAKPPRQEQARPRPLEAPEKDSADESDDEENTQDEAPPRDSAAAG